MDKVKKFLDYILFATAILFGALVFAVMAGNGVYAKSGNLKVGYSVYECFDATKMPLVAMIFVIIVIVIAIGLLVLKALNKDLGFEQFIALGGALLGILAFIFYLCTLTADLNRYGYKLGAGAFFAGLFALIAGCALAFYGVKKLLKK